MGCHLTVRGEPLGQPTRMLCTRRSKAKSLPPTYISSRLWLYMSPPHTPSPIMPEPNIPNPTILDSADVVHSPDFIAKWPYKIPTMEQRDTLPKIEKVFAQYSLSRDIWAIRPKRTLGGWLGKGRTERFAKRLSFEMARL